MCVKCKDVSKTCSKMLRTLISPALNRQTENQGKPLIQNLLKMKGDLQSAVLQSDS